MVGGGFVTACSQLRCSNCGSKVRQEPGVVGKQFHPAKVCETLYTSTKMAKQKEFVRKAPAYRLYVCRCQSLGVDHPRSLSDDGQHDDFRGSAPRDWACSGHSSLTLPVSLDGVQLTAETDYDQLVVDVLLGTVPAHRPSFPGKENWMWLVRLRRLIEHLPQSGELGDGLVKAIGGDDLVQVAGALEVLRHSPGSPEFDAVVRLVESADQTWVDSPNPRIQHWTMGKLVQETVAAQLTWELDFAEVSSDSVQAARRSLNWGGAGVSSLLRPLIKYQPDWIVRNIDSVLRASHEPATLNVLLSSMFGKPQFSALVAALRSSERSDSAEVERILCSYPTT